MKRTIASVTMLPLLLGGTTVDLLAQRASRGSVSASAQSRSGSRGTYNKSGNTGTWQGQRASGSRTVDKSGDSATIDKTLTTQSGASKSVSREVDAGDREADRSSTTTNAWGQSASRSREIEAEGGWASIESSASTSTGRKAEFEGAATRNVYGQPVVAGSVNTKYNGSYNTAAARTPYGGWNTAVAGPYGGRVTTTLPSGYRTATYYGRPYYAYGGAYYRPYTYHGVPHYYPVPMPYYAYYDTPPVGATILMVAGVKYLVSKEGNYSKQTTTSTGQVAYQSVPAPQGAAMTTLPPQRALVTVGGTTYYVNANTFYRRVMNGAQESFVVVTAPAGVVFVGALPADFEVVQLNTMYFEVNGNFYVPYLSPDGKEMYLLVDRPPAPPAGTPAQASAPAPATAPAQNSAPPAAPAVQAVAERFDVPAGTVLVVRLATEVSSKTATTGNRFQGFLDQDLAANGRLVAARGARAYGIVTAVNGGSKMKGQASVTVALTDLQIGERYLSIKVQPLTVKGDASSGGKKLAGGLAVGAAIGAIADGGEGAAIGAAIGAGVGGAAAASGSVDAAIVPAQTPQAFTLAAPLQIEVMTNVAVR